MAEASGRLVRGVESIGLIVRLAFEPLTLGVSAARPTGPLVPTLTGLVGWTMLCALWGQCAAGTTDQSAMTGMLSAVTCLVAVASAGWMLMLSVSILSPTTFDPRFWDRVATIHVVAALTPIVWVLPCVAGTLTALVIPAARPIASIFGVAVLPVLLGATLVLGAREAIRRRDAQREPTCLECGYPLTGLGRMRCPECGSATPVAACKPAASRHARG